MDAVHIARLNSMYQQLKQADTRTTITNAKPGDKPDGYLDIRILDANWQKNNPEVVLALDIVQKTFNLQNDSYYAASRILTYFDSLDSHEKETDGFIELAALNTFIKKVPYTGNTKDAFITYLIEEQDIRRKDLEESQQQSQAKTNAQNFSPAISPESIAADIQDFQRVIDFLTDTVSSK